MPIPAALITEMAASSAPWRSGCESTELEIEPVPPMVIVEPVAPADEDDAPPLVADEDDPPPDELHAVVTASAETKVATPSRCFLLRYRMRPSW
jgi:hypothetical protein